MYKKMIVSLCALSLSLTGLAVAAGRDGGDDRGQNGSTQGPEDQKRVRAKLSGPAIGGEKPSGSAVSVTNDGRSKFTVEVEDVNLPDGAMLTVVLVHEGNRMRVGSMTVAQGGAELERRSQDGDQTPQPQSGDTLLVMQGGTNRLAGVFF